MKRYLHSLYKTITARRAAPALPAGIARPGSQARFAALAGAGMLTLAASLAGCTKEPGANGTAGIAELAFTATVLPGAATPAPPRAATEPLPDGTILRAMIFTANEDPARATPLAQGCYRITGNTGTAIPQTPADRIALKIGTYDLYFTSPETAPVAGKVTAANGKETLTSGKQTLEMKPDANGKCNIAVQLKRRSAMLNTVIYYELASGITSLAVDPQSGMTITGLPATAEVPLDGTPFTPTGNDGTAHCEANRFKTATQPAGIGTAGISTYTDGTHRGVPVLAGIADIKVSVPVVLDGTTAKNYTATVAATRLEEGKYYTLKLKVSRKGHLAATIVEWIPSPGNGEQGMGRPSEDLSKAATANSYIVSKADYGYKFDARVKGNGKATLKVDDPDVWPDQRAKINPDDDLIAPKPLVPASAFVIWSTGNSLDAVVQDVTVKDGYVYFTTVNGPDGSFVAGNVLIGVKDADGTLIWSWHIWATDYDPATDDVSYTTRALVGNDRPYPGGIIPTSSRSFRMMGRNLGALNNTPGSLESIGLMYQWGRKDPFPSAGRNPARGEDRPFESVYPSKNADGYTWTSIGTFDEGVGSDADASIAYTIQHPTVYLECAYGSNVQGDWLNVNASYADQRDYLWGNPNPTDKMPNTLPGSKSIYDPCPPGYRVPRQDSWTSFSTDNVKVNGPGLVNATTATYYDGMGFTFYCHPTSTSSYYTTYYPGTGRRRDWYALFDKNNLTNGFYWSSSSMYGGYREAGNFTFSQGNEKGHINALAYSNGERAFGNFVRCARE